ncbi:MAG: hypothetical protein GXO76_05865 [Calditrichaeota bacterium]|nr:hypothetical protein [Calditrichota bacterium]
MANTGSVKDSEKGALKGLAFGLFGFSVSFLAVLVVTYVALYGPELPVTVKWRTEVVTGEEIRLQNLQHTKKALQDSVKVLKNSIREMQVSIKEIQKKYKKIQADYRKLAARKSILKTRVTVLQTKTDSLNNALTREQVTRIQRVAKMLKTMNGQKVGKFLLSLDNKTILTLLQISPEKQAATILSALEPSRAAALTQKYVSLN